MIFHLATLACAGLMVLIAFTPGVLAQRWEAVQFFGMLAIIAALYATRRKE